jgi:hypothetical protein
MNTQTNNTNPLLKSSNATRNENVNAPKAKTLDSQPTSTSFKTPQVKPFRTPEPFAPVDTPTSPQQETKETSFGDSISAAVESEWVVSGMDDIDRVFKEYNQEGTKVSIEDFDRLDDSYDEDQLHAFRDLVGEQATADEWDDHIAEFAQTNEARKLLSEQGLKGAGISIGAAILDPSFIALTTGSVVAGDKITGTILAGQKLGRIGAITKAVAEAGLAGATGTAILTKTQNDYTTADAMVDTLAALAVTGGLGALASKSSQNAAQALGNAEAERKVAESSQSIGAAKVKGNAGPLRLDDYGRFSNSDNQVLMRFAQDALQDGIGGGSHSAAVRAARSREGYQSKLNAAMEEIRSIKMKETASMNTPFTEKSVMHDLSEKVWESVVMDADHGPEVSKVANSIRSINAGILKDSKRAELHGFSSIDESPNYMRQQWSQKAWIDLRKGEDAFEEKDVTDLIYRSLDSFDDELPIRTRVAEKQRELDTRRLGQPDGDHADLADELEELKSLRQAREFLAAGFTRRMLDSKSADPRSIEELLDDDDSILKFFEDLPQYQDLDKGAKQSLLRTIVQHKPSDVKDVVSQAKNRVQINPAISMTKGKRTVRVADLMNRDAFGLQGRYISDMTGHVAMAERAGIKSPADWESLKADAKRVALDNGHSVDKAEKAPVLLDEMRREISGYNRYGMDSELSKSLGVMGQYNFMTAMGKAAFSAFSELGRTLAENRARNVLKLFPMLPKIMMDAARNVTKDTSLIKEVNQFGAGIGDEALVRRFLLHDEVGVKESTGLLNKAEILAHRGSRAMAKASFLAPVDKMLRFVAFQSSTNALYSHLIKGQSSRMAFEEIGLHPELRARIKIQMQDHGVKTDRFGNVQQLNIDSWDRKTADEFMDAMAVNNARQVQKSLAGERVSILSSMWGRVFFQFRTFAIDSWVKHARADIRSARNGQGARVALSTVYSLLLAAGTYSARSVVSTVGMSDEKSEEYLEERLSPDRLAANMAAYSPNLGAASTLYNATVGSLLPDVAIPISRSTGLASHGVAQTPTTAAIDRFYQGFQNVPDTEMTDVYKSGRFGIPFQNTIWGDLIINNAARLTEGE